MTRASQGTEGPVLVCCWGTDFQQQRSEPVITRSPAAPEDLQPNSFPTPPSLRLPVELEEGHNARCPGKTGPALPKDRPGRSRGRAEMEMGY